MMVAMALLLLPGLRAFAAPGATYSFVCAAPSTLNLTLSSFTLEAVPSTGGPHGTHQTSYTGTMRLHAGKGHEDLQTLLLNNPVQMQCTLTANVNQSEALGRWTGSSRSTWELRAVELRSVTAVGSDGANGSSGGADVPTLFIQVSFTCASASFSYRP